MSLKTWTSPPSGSPRPPGRGSPPLAARSGLLTSWLRTLLSARTPFCCKDPDRTGKPSGTLAPPACPSPTPSPTSGLRAGSSSRPEVGGLLAATRSKRDEGRMKDTKDEEFDVKWKNKILYFFIQK